MNLAPIILFCYNRPKHVLQTLDALFKNDLADQSVLYIYCDGAKHGATVEQLENIEKTRAVARSKQWCKEVHIIEQKKNKGLADSIVEGVTNIVNEYGKIIVLEDDIVTSKGFLKYMNDALNIYENEKRVMHISGFMYPTESNEQTTVFLKILSCWGWATWKRAWDNFQNDVDIHIDNIKTKKQIKNFNINGHADFYDQLLANKNGSMKTWAVRWYSSWLSVGGITLFPSKTLVNNIGHDGSGDNCPIDDRFYSELADKIVVSFNNIQENITIRKQIDLFYKRMFKRSLKSYTITFIKKKVRGIIRLLKK